MSLQLAFILYLLHAGLGSLSSFLVSQRVFRNLQKPENADKINAASDSISKSYRKRLVRVMLSGLAWLAAGFLKSH